MKKKLVEFNLYTKYTTFYFFWMGWGVPYEQQIEVNFNFQSKLFFRSNMFLDMKQAYML